MPHLILYIDEQQEAVIDAAIRARKDFRIEGGTMTGFDNQKAVLDSIDVKFWLPPRVCTRCDTELSDDEHRLCWVCEQNTLDEEAEA